MSERIVAITILGLGETTSTSPSVFTTKETLLYGGSVRGTVVSLGNQLSSEIQVFGSLGSDSTTSFTVLSTAATRRLLMSRGKREVYDSDLRQPVRMNGYVYPRSGVVEIPVPDPSLFTVDGYYRVQNTVFKVDGNVGYLTGSRVWGCGNVPIAMTQQGVGNEPLGSIVYDLNGTNPLGGCEQLPVVITTEELDGSGKEVIFRGYVNKVSNDTSAGQQNLIKVDCSSMMAYIKSAPFIPAWGPVTANTTREEGRIYQTGGNAAVIQTVYTTPWLDGVYGRRFDPLTTVAGDTAVNLWQIREEGKGGINAPLPAHETPDEVRVLNQVGLEFDGTLNATASNNNYAMMFNGGYYEQGGGAFGPNIQLNIDVKNIRRAEANGENSRGWSSDAVVQSATVRGENCIESQTFAFAILDLLLGTHDADLTLSTGARSATESAWLPYDFLAIGDLIDLPSLFALTGDLAQPDVVEIVAGTIVTEQTFPRAILPYEHSSAKTVGDVLDGILKRLGAYMVYDRGKFWFGSWAGARQTPTIVTDAALSDPGIKLTFDRGTCLMRVKAKYCTHVGADVTTYEVPYLNVDLAASALGKEMSIGHWFSGAPHNPDAPFWGNTRLMANAFGLIMRYSQSAARVDLSLRDSANDLQVGQQVALTLQYVVNSEGEMGISGLLGYVLKAARSWATPTTSYTIILPGYVSPSNKTAVWSCSAVVVDVPGGDFIQVETNYFVAPPGLFDTGAPPTDAEAFQYTHDLMGSWYDVQLLDQYGTLKYQGALVGVDVPLSRLELPGFDAYAAPGDIIVLADASYFGSVNINNIYDVFQANDAGAVAGSEDNARKWVP
jgi:hypothetical protein